jgi:hypothetical protein
MKQARLFCIAVFSALALYGATGFYFLPLASFTGPLTRMGKIPESLFGWTKEQPVVNPKYLVNASWQEADVLAIGDSFSIPHLWQSVLVKNGLKVHTETWEAMRDVCEDFSKWARDNGFKGRYVVIETVEHNFKDTLNRSIGCRKMDYRTTVELPVAPPPRLMALNASDYSGRFSVGIETELHALQYQRLSARSDFKTWYLGNNVRMNRVKDGCNLFSHKSCKDALFLADDQAGDFGKDILDKMQIIDDRLKGFHLVWVIVPNKTTTYLHPEKQFWNKAEQRFHAPNLLKVLRQKIEARTIDLYPANETHLSTTGYLILGDEIYRHMR